MQSGSVAGVKTLSSSSGVSDQDMRRKRSECLLSGAARLAGDSTGTVTQPASVSGGTSPANRGGTCSTITNVICLSDLVTETRCATMPPAHTQSRPSLPAFVEMCEVRLAVNG